jgi:hypothetical protein
MMEYREGLWVSNHRLFYLSIDRPAPFLLIAQSVVGLFCSAGSLVLLSGGKLGPQIFLPLVPALGGFSPGSHRFGRARECLGASLQIIVQLLQRFAFSF